MQWQKEQLKKFRLYAVTDVKKFDKRVLKTIEHALRNGVDVIQLRSKILTDRELFELGSQIHRMTRRLRKLFIVNDRVDLAAALDADGVHLGQDDLPVSVARRFLKGKIVGKSTHSLQQARAAISEGADYIGFGPVYGTPTKPHYKPVGLRDIASLHKLVKKPIVCIGGIDASNVEEVVSAGGRRIAVVRAIFSSQDAGKAARLLRLYLE